MFKNYAQKVIATLFLLGIAFIATAQTARVQIIHNCPDDIADSVDVYLNGTLLLDNFPFRSATPFVDVTAGSAIDIDIAPKNSTGVGNSIYNLNTTLTQNETYIAVAQGITGLSTTAYSDTPVFEIDVFAMGREQAATTGNTDVLVYHGSTDAPAVDVFETAVLNATAANNLEYSQFQGYLELPTDNYVLQVQDSTGAVAVASFDAPLQGLGLQDSALTVLASGFLNPAANGNGPAFGLYVALATGGDLIPLPASTARLQAIHNCADDIADSVDIYLNGNLLLDNFPFRTATPFIDAPAGVNIDIDVAPKTSTSVANSIYTLSTMLTSGETYIAVAAGITGLSSTSYSSAPAFEIDVFAAGREMASTAGNTDVLVYHGSTDAPTVDVTEVAVLNTVAADDLAYSDFAGYLELPTDNYALQVSDSTGSTVVATYDAPLQSLGLQDSAITVLASGFLTPANNGNGPAFGLFVALPTGGDLVPLSASTIGLEESKALNVNVYPNPTAGLLFIGDNESYNITLSDLSGKTVMAVQSVSRTLDISALQPGVYTLSMEHEGMFKHTKLVKQ